MMIYLLTTIWIKEDKTIEEQCQLNNNRDKRMVDNEELFHYYCRFSLFQLFITILTQDLPPSMKFVITENQQLKDATNKDRTAMDEERDQTAYVYYNVLHPTNKIQCDSCKKDISKHTKILAEENDYCAACFALIEEFPTSYHVINKLDYPLFDVEWTADEELLMFEGLEKHGFGNWSEIAEFMGTNKSREEVETHYTSIYLESPDFLPENREILSKRDQQTNKLNKESSQKILKRKARQEISNSKNQRGYLTVNNQTSSTTKTGANPAEIIGYMPRRGDFEVEYDNEAELLLAEMEFNNEDTEEEKDMKFKLIDIYNHKLTERIRRKQFVISRNLLDLKEQSRIEKMKSKEEKDIYHMLRYFSRFNTVEGHERLVQGIIKEKQIRQRIEQLKEFKKKGFRTVGEIEQELENKRKKDEKMRKKGQESTIFGSSDPSKTRRSAKNPTVDHRSEKRTSYISREEDELCKKFNISIKNYLNIKDKIIRESIKQGILERDNVSKLFKIERNTIDSIFDYLVEKEDIISR